MPTQGLVTPTRRFPAKEMPTQGLETSHRKISRDGEMPTQGLTAWRLMSRFGARKKFFEYCKLSIVSNWTNRRVYRYENIRITMKLVFWRMGNGGKRSDYENI